MESNQKRGRVNRIRLFSSFRDTHEHWTCVHSLRLSSPPPNALLRVAGRGRAWGRLSKLDRRVYAETPPTPDPSPPRAKMRAGGRGKKARSHHCVFATRGGVAVVTNCVASSMALPSGVGIFMRNGTRMRVPRIGAKAISMLR
jgi:hypothetical protein